MIIESWLVKLSKSKTDKKFQLQISPSVALWAISFFILNNCWIVICFIEYIDTNILIGYEYFRPDCSKLATDKNHSDRRQTYKTPTVTRAFMNMQICRLLEHVYFQYFLFSMWFIWDILFISDGEHHAISFRQVLLKRHQ